MPGYKESAVSGTSYERCRSLYFENPKGSDPSVLIREERLTKLGDFTITEHAAEILATFPQSELGTVFLMYNPVTDELITGKEMTYMEFHTAMYSLYRHRAELRDAKEAADKV